MLMNKKQVMDFLPHREPFLFIDTVTEIIIPPGLDILKVPLTPTQLIGGKTICTFRVDSTVKVLEGHFPGDPILPGVVQVVYLVCRQYLFHQVYMKQKHHLRHLIHDTCYEYHYF